MMHKMVIKVQITCEKCRKKAMKIAAKADGVIKMELKEGKDELVVTGNEVDPVKLTRSLRKGVGAAFLQSLQEEKDEKEKKEKEEEKEEKKFTPIEWAYLSQFTPPPCHQFFVDPNPSPNCSIM